MTTSNPAASVRDLRKSYGHFTALDGVSFDIQHDETFALLGPNGAGKSTTIEILEGYRDRSSGRRACSAATRGAASWRGRHGSASCCGRSVRKHAQAQSAMVALDPSDGDAATAQNLAALPVNRLSRPVAPAFSPREKEVLGLVALGQSNPEIAQSLFLSEATVKTHLLHALEKLGVNDRTRAVTKAMELGYL